MDEEQSTYDPQPDEGEAPDPIEEPPAPTKKKPRPAPRGLNDHGFRIGSNSATIVDILIAGGADRQDINDRVATAIGTHTKNGHVKNIPSLISGLLARLESKGYHIESSWKVVPPVPSKKRTTKKK